jgi:hypothetical protein
MGSGLPAGCQMQPVGFIRLPNRWASRLKKGRQIGLSSGAGSNVLQSAMLIIYKHLAFSQHSIWHAI